MGKSILVCVAGLGGAIGNTLSVGLSVADSTKSVKFGMATESPIIKSLGLDLPSLGSFMIEGWDITNENLYSRAKKHEICPAAFITRAKEKIENIRPRFGFIKDRHSIKEWILCESQRIKKLCHENTIEHVIVINLLPTEKSSLQVKDNNIDWEKLDTLEFNQEGVTLSRIYFRLAIEIGAHFINFTPNIAETPSLRKLANKRGIIYCGRDGKTGQTFLKTVIAPALRDKNFLIDGWFSTNILGNNDGLTLLDRDCCLTKRTSKMECLSSILGYHPGGEGSDFSHQVHIHYYPPRGDSKEAWDNIDFTGFLGSKMQMKIDWLGKDSILAVPSIIDLIRIVCLAAQNEYTGLLGDVSYFFKSPLTNDMHSVQHSVPDQFNLLVRFLKKYRRIRDNSPYYKLANFLSSYHKDRQISLSMRVSEIKMSRAATIAMAHDLHNRCSFDHQGVKAIEDSVFGESRNIQYLTNLCKGELKKAINADYISLNPLSDLNAADLVITSYCHPRDTVYLIPSNCGGYPALSGLVRSLDMNVKYIPFDEKRFDVVWDEFNSDIENDKPSLIFFNPDDLLFPYTFNRINNIEDNETVLIIDVSQFLGFIIGGELENPLTNGFDALIGSTYKTFPGPHKGFFASKDKTLMEKFEENSNRRIISTYTHHLLALAISLLEFNEYGNRFAIQVVKNANAFGKGLEDANLDVVSRDGIYSETHQVWLKQDSREDGIKALHNLLNTGIYCNLGKLDFSLGWGIKFGVQEATLLGCRESDIQEIASLVAEAIRSNASSKEVKRNLSLILRGLTPIWEPPDIVLNLLNHYVFN